MKTIQTLQINELAGYNKELEDERSDKFREYILAKTSEERVRTWTEFRDLTAQRSPEFVRELERLYGINIDEEAANDAEK